MALNLDQQNPVDLTVELQGWEVRRRKVGGLTSNIAGCPRSADPNSWEETGHVLGDMKTNIDNSKPDELSGRREQMYQTWKQHKMGSQMKIRIINQPSISN